MSLVKILFSVVVVAGVVGGIVYLEAQKVAPGDALNVVEEIRLEDNALVADKEKVSIEDATTEELLSELGVDGSSMATKTNEESDVESAPAAVTEPESTKTITQTQADSIALKADKYPRAKEISTPDGFINVDDIALKDLVGKKIVMIDFWTYSCINCQRTTPYLNSWYSKYEDDDFVIVGIHTPEFNFEKDYNNVLDATKDLGIEFPVVLDNDYSTWRAYNNRYWPHKFLIDIDGFIVYDHIGEGAYSETENKIVELINEKNRRQGKPEITVDPRTPSEVDSVNFGAISSHETYLGSTRMDYNVVPLQENCKGESCTYEKPAEIPKDQFAFAGEWQVNSQSSELKESPGSLFYNFGASKVNLVAGSMSEVKAEVYLDGELVTGDVAGSDVVDGVVTIKEHTLYNLIDLGNSYENHTVEIRFLDAGVSVYAFTFG